MIKGIIFDFDGTLVPSNEVKTKILIDFFSQLISDKPLVIKLVTEGQLNRYEIFDRIVKFTGSQGKDKTEFFNDLDFHLENAICNLPEKNGVTNLFSALRNNHYGTFLNSATPLATLEKIIDCRKWSPYFDLINGAPVKKSDFISIVLKLGYSNNELLVFGDGSDDEDSAKVHRIEFVSARSDDAIYQLMKKLDV
jgi:phosphoglycolate phosphatase-like HAD superfamily hydrolase